MDIRKAIFLDRDGTIIEDRGHLSCVEDVEFYPFTYDALRILQKQFFLFIVTNQSSVGLKLISPEAAARVNNFVMSDLQSHGITVQELYCCGHCREDNCECIKPKPYFINKAQSLYDLRIPQSFTVGDHPHDVTFGTAAGATGVYVLTGHGAKHRSEVETGTPVFDNLLEAARWIDQQATIAVRGSIPA